MNKIPLRNKKGDIVAYTIVSPEDYQHLNQFKWSKTLKGYTQGTVNKSKWSLHKYIKLEILKEIIPTEYVVDHIDNNPLNNHRDNLRFTTRSENSRNRKEKQNFSSKYVGVTKEKDIFRVSISIDGKQIFASYKNEIHAAHQYNLWIEEYNLTTANKNIINIPIDSVKHVSRISLKELPAGIEYNKTKTRFQVRITINKIRKTLGTFDTLEEAILIRNKAENERDIMFKEKVLAIPKIFNEDGQCVFKIGENEIIIDENLFYDIIKYNWWIQDGYVKGRPEGKPTLLARFIMKYQGELYVDHINNNKLDNRKSNLRLATPQENAQNTSSREGSSSNHVGVCFRKDSKKWRAYITVNKEMIHLGTFTNEIDAAKARDIATLTYYGDHGNFNFPDGIV